MEFTSNYLTTQQKKVSKFIVDSDMTGDVAISSRSHRSADAFLSLHFHGALLPTLRHEHAQGRHGGSD